MAIFSPRCFISVRRYVVTALTVLSTDILFELGFGIGGKDRKLIHNSQLSVRSVAALPCCRNSRQRQRCMPTAGISPFLLRYNPEVRGGNMFRHGPPPARRTIFAARDERAQVHQGCNREKKCHSTTPPETDTLIECLTPAWGISMAPSQRSTTSCSTPATSLPKTSA